MTIKLTKSKIAISEVKAVGIRFCNGGVQVDEEKLSPLRNIRAPSDKNSLQRFLGLVGFFKPFYKHFSQTTEPLSRLLKKSASWRWGSSEQAAFNSLRDKLLTEPVTLESPHPGWPYVLGTDASETCIGAVLQQVDTEGHRRIIATASRTLTDCEKRWHTREKEAVAIVWGVLKFTGYLRGLPTFDVETDHASLAWLWRGTSQRLVRWRLALQEYNMKIHYRRGSENAHADVLSRDVEFSDIDRTCDDILNREVETTTYPKKGATWTRYTLARWSHWTSWDH
eukprot:GHVS01083268.1.p1 GENE.GHVS01083268.1~~GHVS01083268.1.p1  ORF type:complete len:282 (+),score=1.82 GHVS01083268.1:3-848(+)